MTWTNMKWLFLALGITKCLQLVFGRTLDEQFQIISRDKRYLTYTYGSAIGMFLAFAVPVELPDRDVLFSYNFEANYNLPTNISHYDLTPPDRSFFQSFNRTYLYGLLQKHMGSFGNDGRNCLLNTICEVVKSPVSHNGLIGHFLHVMLTIGGNIEKIFENHVISATSIARLHLGKESTHGWYCATHMSWPSSSESEGLKEEEEAERKGREEDCAKLYKCSRNFLADISELVDEI